MRHQIFAAGALLAVFALPVSADIVINEILPNPSGDDVGTERVEIYNNGPSAVDVTGWAIDDAATIDEVAVRARIPEDFDISVCPASAIIQPGEYRVVKGQSTSPYLNNGGDDVYLISDRTLNPNVVDVVTYPSASSQVNNVWAAVPDGSTNFAWHAISLCGSNGGAGDTTPPATITNLLAGPGDFPGEVLLTWTATGDDSLVGTASEYEIKISSGAINSGNFAAATDLEAYINEPLPQISATLESLYVFGLNPAQTFFFALRAIDDASNESGVSNSPSTMPAAGALLDPDLGYNAYYGNLHSHTSYSDGDLTPTDAYNYARNTAQTPLDFLAVTDHNHSGAGMNLPDYHLGLAQAAAANSDGNFVAIYGQEWGLGVNGHANIFESPVLYGWEGGNYDVFVAEGDYASLYAAVKANPPASYPPIVMWCHPQSSDFSNLAVTGDSPDVVHLISLVNGPAFSVATDESDIGNTGFDDTYQDALRKGHRVSPTADQDNHNSTWGAATESRTAVLADTLTKSGILGALSIGRNYATQDHNVVVHMSVNGHAMGEAFTQPEGASIVIEVIDPDGADSTAMIELYRGMTDSVTATRVAFNEGSSTFAWRETETFTAGTEMHYYARIRQGDAQQIWTAPAYVTYDVSTDVAQEADVVPPFSRIRFESVRPNPTRGRTFVSFALPTRDDDVSVRVYDVAGRAVRTLLDGSLAAGTRTIEWDGRTDRGEDATAGIYFLHLETRAHGSATTKMTVLR